MSYSKSVESAIVELHDDYNKIKKRYKNKSNRVLLGRSFSMGSQFQYNLASKLFSKYGFLVLVDYPIKLPNRRQCLYPDILVIKNNRLIGIIEVKIDLGLIRLGFFGIKHTKRSKEKYSYSKKENKFMKHYNELSNSDYFTYKILNEDGTKTKSKPVMIGKKIEKISLVVTKHNHPKREKCFYESMKDSGFKLLFILEKIHPNDQLNCTKKIISEEISKKRAEIKRVFNAF